MLWVILSLVGAFANALFYIIIRRYITTLDPRLLAGMGSLAGGAILLLISGIQGFPPIGQAYYSAVIASGVLNIIGLSLIFAAMVSSDLSLSMPLLSFTPVFLVSTSYVLLHEMPSPAGIAGICIIVGGSYVLNISAGHEHLLDPVRSMIRNRGSWYMLLVAFIFAVSINYDKIAMLNSGPVFGMAFTLFIISSGLFLVTMMYPETGDGLISDDEASKHTLPPLPKEKTCWSDFLVPAAFLSVCVVAECISINLAYTLQIAPYVIAIKRLGIILMVLYGTILCSENEVRTRLLGALLMVGGAVIILVFT